MELRMTSAERVGLERALKAHPGLRSKVGEPWRIKRLSPGDLRRLARELGVDLAPVQARVEKQRAAAMLPLYPARQVAKRPPPTGAFTGSLTLPLEMVLLGSAVTRSIRITWGYTPAWEHMDKAGKRLVADAAEEFVFISELKAEPDATAFQMRPDGSLEKGPMLPHWVPFDLLGHGVLSTDLNAEIERLIDEDARRQNGERLERGGWA
jgi:hypothetical protein